MVYVSRDACLHIAFREWHLLRYLGGERVHADDALEPPRVRIEQVRERLEYLALRGAHQRAIGRLEAFAAITPSGITRLSQSEERSRTSAVQRQIKG